MKKSLTENYMKRNLVELVQSGEDFIVRLEHLIVHASREIHLQTYIFEPDETGRRIMDALKTASLVRHIKVFILVDALGSQNLSTTFRNELKDAGIHIRRFGRFYSNGKFHIGRRLHRKVIVADGRRALVGGINISNKYTDQSGSPAWLDFAVEVEGEAARRLLLVCRKRWMNIRFKAFPKKLREGISQRNFPLEARVRVRVSQNDFIHRKNQIALTYRQQIRTCTESLIMVGGYFLPGGRIRRLLKQAVQRGVDIKIIVSENSDVRMVLLARRYLYSWLLRNHIRIYEYLPSNVHGKVLFCDKKFVSVGSYDLNNLSTYSNIELNLDILDENFSRHFHEKIEKIIEKDCRLLTEENFRKRLTLLDRFFTWVSYQLVKTFFVLALVLARRSQQDE